MIDVDCLADGTLPAVFERSWAVYWCDRGVLSQSLFNMLDLMFPAASGCNLKKHTCGSLLPPALLWQASLFLGWIFVINCWHWSTCLLDVHVTNVSIHDTVIIIIFLLCVKLWFCWKQHAHINYCLALLCQSLICLFNSNALPLSLYALVFFKRMIAIVNKQKHKSG